MTEKLVSVETEGEKMGARIESKIISGERVVIIPGDREKLRGALEHKGVDLQLFEVPTAVRLTEVPEGVEQESRQAKELEAILGGREQFIKYCQEILVETISEERRAGAEGFVSLYVEEHTKDGYLRFGKKKDRLKNRLEALISITHNLFRVASERNDEKAEKIMNGGEFVKCVRERVIRGWEKPKREDGRSKMNVPEEREVPRRDEKTIRTISVGGMMKIVEYWMR